MHRAFHLPIENRVHQPREKLVGDTNFLWAEMTVANNHPANRSERALIEQLSYDSICGIPGRLVVDEDVNARFIFLWIAFNAAYAHEILDRRASPEQKILANSLGRLVEADVEKVFYRILWEEYPGPIRLLIDNPYVHAPFFGTIRRDRLRNLAGKRDSRRSKRGRTPPLGAWKPWPF